ncbi:phage head-tail connector protein [Bacillus halotolerans]|uniref:phage head-tail connector protein n=1 Tax=Bacillus halotolerans TaxID=260554 RepID=UPI0020C4CEF3|nr:phage head-tail connector protein [Bacillus halotolerans]UTL77888.1 phage head-tail connector protein [Bacillus halotolerans]WJE44335.1 phage head-tail connector protein [Bacillus halotolerans]WPC81886.1 phage head-tail connector protein [Bacillus halotolerans]
MDKIKTLKILLDQDDVSSDELLNLYLSSAESFIKNYCDIESLPSELDLVHLHIAVFQYRQNGYEALTAEKIGNISQTFKASMPDHIIDELDKFIRNTKYVKFI